jgi:hypothetical protein
MNTHLELRVSTLFTLALLTVTTTASAHGMDAGRVTVELEGRVLLVVATPKATSFDFADDSGDDRLTRLEVKAHRTGLRAAFDAALTVVDDQGRRPKCQRTDVSTPVFTNDPNESADHVRVTARCEFDVAPSAIWLSYAFAAEGPVVVEAVRLQPRSPVAGRPTLPVRVGAGERVALASGDAQVRMLALHGEKTAALGSSDAGSSEPSASEASSAAPRTVGTMGFLRFGVSHVLYGLDHILFIVALVLSTTRRRDLFAAITAFTVTHTLALALVVTGTMAAPSSDWIEPAIALSIAVTALFVGLAPKAAPSAARSALRLVGMAAGFGLIHGLGMASSAFGTFQDAAADMLIPFTAGAELAQLMLAALASAVATVALTPTRRRAAAWALVVVGLSWFVVRLDLGAPTASAETVYDQSLGGSGSLVTQHAGTPKG